MAQRLMMLHYEDQLHKIRLTPNEPKVVTIGNAWSDTVTFLTMETKLSIEWDGESCSIDNKKLKPNEQITLKLTNGAMHFYLIEADEWDIYDSASNYSLTFGPNVYDEVTIENTPAD